MQQVLHNQKLLLLLTLVLLKSKKECFKFTVKTQERCINISVLLWQHVPVLLDNFQATIQRYDVQSVHIVTYDGYRKLEYFRTKFASAGNKRLFKLMPHLSHEAPDLPPPGCVAEGN